MNLYILVEGKTEGKIYPKWLSHLLPSFNRVDSPEDAIEKNYYLISCGGYPGILDNYLAISVADVNNSNKFSHLIIVIDTDNLSSEEKTKEVYDYIEENNIQLINCELTIITQTVCMETWFLGNKKIYSRNPQNTKCSKFSNYFNTSEGDPETMLKDPDYQGTNANFHFEYLKAMLREKNIRYSKSHPQGVGEEHYLKKLQNRLEEDKNSLSTMRNLFNFLDKISS